MVGVKRPARDSDTSRTKKLKVQNGMTARPTQVGKLPSKHVPAQSTDSENAFGNSQGDSDLSADEDGEDSDHESAAARLGAPQKILPSDHEEGNGVLNGQYPLEHIAVHARTLH